MWAGKGEFPVSQTHRIAFMPGNHLLVSSEGRGWRNLYASLATEQSWSATVRPVDHLCLAYCVSGSAHIKRRILGTGQTHAADLRPRSFGSIPSGVESGWQVNGTPQVMLLYLRRALIDQVVNDVFEGDARRVEIRPILGKASLCWNSFLWRYWQVCECHSISITVCISTHWPIRLQSKRYMHWEAGWSHSVWIVPRRAAFRQPACVVCWITLKPRSTTI